MLKSALERRGRRSARALAERYPGMRRGVILALAASLFPACASRGMAEETPDWASVSAIFTERCVMCHSKLGAAKGLRLDSYAGARAGSERGAVLRPGDPAHSELIRRLRGESIPRMPFLSTPLPPEQIDLIERWIEAGLPEGARQTELAPVALADPFD